MYGSCSDELAEAPRKTAKEKLETYMKRMNKELAEKGRKERLVVEEKKAVCIRCGCGIAFPCGHIAAEEAINSMREGGGNLVR